MRRAGSFFLIFEYFIPDPSLSSTNRGNLPASEAEISFVKKWFVNEYQYYISNFHIRL
jgi:hypothetical protein